MSENETIFLIMAALVAFIIGLSKGGLGGTAGALATPLMALAHTGGPPVSIYLLMQRVTPAVFIATSALFFSS